MKTNAAQISTKAVSPLEINVDSPFNLTQNKKESPNQLFGDSFALNVCILTWRYLGKIVFFRTDQDGFEDARRLRSVPPSMPSTCPVLLYCQMSQSPL